MALDDIGSRAWTDVLTRAAEAAGYDIPAGSGISLGGVIHDKLIPPGIKPGTRAYLARLRELAAAAQSPWPSGLVGLWKFLEAAGPYASEGGDAPISLAVANGTPTPATSGPFGGGVNLTTGRSLIVPFAQLGRLAIPGGQVSVIAYVQRTTNTGNLAMVAGRWDEADSSRQYCLFHHIPSYAGGRRPYGHVSKTGGATPGGWNFSVDGSATARKTLGTARMRMMGFTYDGAEAISYLDGLADSFPTATVTQASPPMSMTTPRNPYPYPDGLNQASTAPFRVGAAGPTNLNSWDGALGALWVFDRKLTPAEMMQVHLTAIPDAWPIFQHTCYEDSGQISIAPQRLGFRAWSGAAATDVTTATNPWSTNTPAGLNGAEGYISVASASGAASACLYKTIGADGGIPLDAIGRLSIRVNHSQSNTTCRLLIEVDGGACYATDAPLADQFGANTDWTASTQQNIAFLKAGAGWRDVVINTGVELSMAGAARSQPLPGSRLTGIGIYSPSRAQALRATDFGVWKSAA